MICTHAVLNCWLAVLSCTENVLVLDSSLGLRSKRDKGAEESALLFEKRVKFDELIPFPS